MTEEHAYVPIDRWMVREDTIQTCDIFYKSPGGKMLLYCSSGQKVPKEMYEKILEFQMGPLFISLKDINRFRFYVENNLDSIITDSRIEISHRAEAAYQSIQLIAAQLFKQPKAEMIRRYRKAIFHILDFVLSDNQALKYLIGLTTYDFSIFNHSINVGIFSIGLAKEIFDDRPDINMREMVAGYFLHDIGKCRIPLDILNKRGPLSRVEWMCIRRHVDDGLEILSEHSLLAKETEIIIAQHHERNDGSGYPNGLRGDRIHVFSRICSIADVFDGLTSYRPYRKEFSTFEALKKMKNEMFRNFDPIFFEKFVNMFGKR